MAFRTLPFVFHDGELVGFTVAPKEELTIEVHLDSHWNQKQDRTVMVRFSAIRNMESVSSFFARVRLPRDLGGSIAAVIDLVHQGERKDAILLDLSGYGSIEIHTRNVTFD